MDVAHIYILCKYRNKTRVVFYLFIYLFSPPVLNPKSYDRAQVLEAPSRPMLVIHSRSQNKKEKGPVEPGKEEEDKLESFFGHLYEFHNPVQVIPVFVPPVSPVITSPMSSHSVVSSASFVAPLSVVPTSSFSSSCIDNS